MWPFGPTGDPTPHRGTRGTLGDHDTPVHSENPQVTTSHHCVDTCGFTNVATQRIPWTVPENALTKRKGILMRKTIMATTAAALLVLSAACGSEDSIDVEGAKDAAASQVDKATSAVGEGADSSASADDKSAEGADGAKKTEGAEGSDSATEMGTIAAADGSEVEVPAGIAQKYEEIQGSNGHLGNPVGEAKPVAGGQMLEFEGGTLVQNPDGQAFLVQGEILKEYMSNGGPEGELGFPTTDETPNDAGFISTFENGEITYDVATEQSTVQQN